MTVRVYLDASRNALSLGLSTASGWAAAAQLEGRHDAVLLPELTRLLGQEGRALASIDEVVCVQGPGSFTGLRIAVSFVHALHLVTGCRVLPVDQLSLMAFVANQNPLAAGWMVVLDARMGDAYLGEGPWDAANPVLPERRLVPIADLPQGVWIGHREEPAFLADRIAHRVAPTIADLRDYAEASPTAQWISGDQLTPLYLRHTIAWKPLAEQPSKLYDR